MNNNKIYIPANLIFNKSNGCKSKVEVTPPVTPAIKCSYLTCLNNVRFEDIVPEWLDGVVFIADIVKWRYQEEMNIWCNKSLYWIITVVLLFRIIRWTTIGKLNFWNTGVGNNYSFSQKYSAKQPLNATKRDE